MKYNVLKRSICQRNKHKNDDHKISDNTVRVGQSDVEYLNETLDYT